MSIAPFHERYEVRKDADNNPDNRHEDVDGEVFDRAAKAHVKCDARDDGRAKGEDCNKDFFKHDFSLLVEGERDSVFNRHVNPHEKLYGGFFGIHNIHAEARLAKARMFAQLIGARLFPRGLGLDEEVRLGEED